MKTKTKKKPLPYWAKQRVTIEIPLEPLPEPNADGLLPECFPEGNAWAGAPCLYWTEDGEYLCHECATKAWAAVAPTDDPPAWCSPYGIGYECDCQKCGRLIQAGQRPDEPWDAHDDYMSLLFSL